MNLSFPLILASSSPRRKFLLHEAGFQFSIISPDIDESFPSQMDPVQVPLWLAEKKAAVIEVTNEVVIASDTVVILGGTILNKPSGRDEGIRMLTDLSAKTHQVATAVCIRSRNKTISFTDTTLVTFRSLTRGEIEYYIDHFHPLDKAGSYGAQDCLPHGMNPCSKAELEFLDVIHKPDLVNKSISEKQGEKRIVIIDKIEGSYFTVMGLPLHRVYTELIAF